ncbi:hypothetical protein [Oscillibacter sp. 1-3]|uniref:hypothetical protein n=1 Tax=Oscillibacter sp. 1-3 TaxID=1235797 RepID=UPI00033ED36F|nr:hypothetical protein [Oscillibacter sp. 1-3]EOS66454.1 hypothetical protein C816_01502 [Oscillibacter sp. 1-3]
MKKLYKHSLTIFFLLAFSLSLCVAASAAVYSSDYLAKYSATISAQGGGVMKVSYTVMATDTIKELGVSKIVVEKKVGNSWIEAETYTSSDYPELSTTNDDVHRGYVLYDGVAGTEYRAKVTVFGNTDYRTVTTTSKRAT